MKNTKFPINIIILHGLPGSGKTTFAKNKLMNNDSSHNSYTYIDLDDTINDKSDKKIEDKIYGELRKLGYKVPENIIIDGLLLTNNDIIKVIDIITSYKNFADYIAKEYYNRSEQFVFNIYIESWNKDIENCLKNDKLRHRHISAETTIKNAPFEKVDKTKIKDTIIDSRVKSIKINKHYVYIPSNMDVYYSDCYIFREPNNKVRSSSWSGGGSYGNCWNNEMSPVDPDEAPKYFAELLDITDSLKTKKPLSIRDYFNIMDKCVITKSKYESDYYGGGVTYYYYELDLADLYDYLLENEYI